MLTKKKHGPFRGPRQGLDLNILSGDRVPKPITFTIGSPHPHHESSKQFAAMGQFNASARPMPMSPCRGWR